MADAVFPPALSPPSTVALENTSAGLAAELAVGLLPVPDILKRHGLAPAQLKTLLRDEQFRNMVRGFKREWHDASNAKERIRLKAQLAVEDNLLELHRLFNDIEINPTARLEAFKQLTALADVAPRKDAGAEGTKFTLNISLGDRQEQVVLDTSQDDAVDDV